MGTAAAGFAVINRLLAFGRDRRGTFAIELAVALPLLVAMLLGTAELARFMLLNEKLDRAASSTGDLVAQARTLASTDLQVIFPVVAAVAAPQWRSAQGVVIISSIGNPNGTQLVVNWQASGAGTLAATSMIGQPAGLATLPAGLTVAQGETVIAAEVFYQWSPIFWSAAAPARRLYHVGYYRPRLGTLNQLN